jgi:DnaJ-class molecular chaperone
MICETCQGKGFVKPSDKGADVPKDAIVPCGECGGTGFAHCCEGLRCQPEGRLAD